MLWIIVLYFSSKSPFTQGYSPLLAWNFLTETAMKYMPRDGNSFLTGMVSEPDRVFSLSLGCLYTAISSSTLGGYTFRPSPSSLLLISDNFIIRKSWHFFKGVLKILRFSLITLTFFLNYRSVGAVSSLAQRFFHRSAPTSTKRASSNS